MKFLLEGKTNSCETIHWLDNNKHDLCENKTIMAWVTTLNVQQITKHFICSIFCYFSFKETSSRRNSATIPYHLLPVIINNETKLNNILEVIYFNFFR